MARPWRTYVGCRTHGSPSRPRRHHGGRRCDRNLGRPSKRVAPGQSFPAGLVGRSIAVRQPQHDAKHRPVTCAVRHVDCVFVADAINDADRNAVADAIGTQEGSSTDAIGNQEHRPRAQKAHQAARQGSKPAEPDCYVRGAVDTDA